VASSFYIGVISGTSIDGLDLALLDVAPTTPSIIDTRTDALPTDLVNILRELAAPGWNEVERMAHADATLGKFIGNAVRAFAQDRRIVAVGSHGQTIRHGPNANPSYTVQIGDPNKIAEISGFDTIADFRRRDMAVGGEGAPLVPLFHDALFRHQIRHRAIVNIGGISNVTFLGPTDISGFDTGPGNALIDAWIRENRNEAFDRNGSWSATGNVITNLLTNLQQDPYLHTSPPKSTGKERYNLEYVRSRLDGSEDLSDIQATLTEFTASSIADAIMAWGPTSAEVIVCGGGRLNLDMMQRLARRLAGSSVVLAEDLGVDGDAIEAAAFAWLAHRFIQRLPGNATSVTGASGARILGALYPATR
jgi:anhydro-N-acetylmuramic acid kinase